MSIAAYAFQSYGIKLAIESHWSFYTRNERSLPKDVYGAGGCPKKLKVVSGMSWPL